MENVIHKEEHRDDTAAKLGMWIFIFTELLLFGGLFLVYSVFRAEYSREFHQAALELNVTIGALNTVILLLSSMTIAMSLTALQKNNKKLSLRLLAITVLMALVFLVNKYFEWGTKFHHGI
jgi:cytochrome c oxidase subunit III